MKLITAFAGCCLALFTITSCTDNNPGEEYVDYVNPFIGTGGHGHTFPGSVVPHGMVQLSPDPGNVCP